MALTRHAIVERLAAECEAAFPGAEAFEAATVDDVKGLLVAVVDALDEFLSQLETESL